jgi:protein translocase SecG subunit
MLYYFVATIYVLVCFLLLIVVLLQQGKGGDMASAFGGGGSQTAFGARQGATVLSKATAVLGGLFMLGAIALAWLGPARRPGTGYAGARSGPDDLDAAGDADRTRALTRHAGRRAARQRRRPADAGAREPCPRDAAGREAEAAVSSPPA